MAQILPKVQEVTNLKSTDTLIVVDESTQVTNPSTGETSGSLRRIQKDSLGFATAETVAEAITTKADAIVKSASGEIASFSDGGDDLPMKSLKVNIVPNQSGSGDPSPSNVRAISGWDSVDVKKMGDSLFYPVQTVSQTISGITIEASGGAFHIYGTSTNAVSTNIFAVDPLTFPSDSAYKVYLGNRTADSNVEVHFYNGTTRLDYWICSTVNRAINMPQSAMSGNTCNGLRFKIQRSVTVDIIVAPYIAKDGDIETITTNLPQTVYGGTLDVVSGELTPKYFSRIFDGTESYFYQSSSRWGWLDTVTTIPYAKSQARADGMCSHFIYGSNDLGGNCIIGTGPSSGAYFFIAKTAIPSITSLNDFKTWVASQYANGTPVRICYELATPLSEIQLTPTEVKTLLGSNNIWADAGTVEVEYRADTTLAYNELLALIASLS